MIYFNCPGCGARMQVPQSAAGRPARCPVCETVAPAPDIRVIAPIVPPRPSSALRVRGPVEEDLSPLEEEEPETEDTGLDPVLMRRQVIRERRRMRWLAAVTVLSVVAVATLAVLIATRGRRAAPKADPPVVAQAAPRPAVAELVRPAERDFPEPRARVKPTRPAEDEPPPATPRPPKPEPQEVEPPRPEPPKGDQSAELRVPRSPRPPEPQPAEDDTEPVSRPKGPFKSDRPAKESFAGYYTRTFLGFKIHVSRFAYEQSDEAEGEPLKVIDDEIHRLVEIFSEKSLKALRSVPIWVEWDHTIPREARAFAVYYGRTGEGLLLDGVDPRKAGCICVLSLKTAVKLKADGKRQNVLLHEFAHVVHDLVWGFDNAFISNAFLQAQARELYDRVRHDDGILRAAYASRNKNEYFAELTCAYLDRLDYPPHDAKELKEFDSVGYEIMTKAWGTPEEIERARKKGRKPKP